jgi:2-methylisocitrate lyase-like PEP mutase family enzyme
MMVEAVGRIVAVVQVPITADIESGYEGRASEDVAETVRMVIGAGASGINLEDSPGRGDSQLLDIPGQCQRLEAARLAAEREGVNIFINARIDTYLLGVGAPHSRVEDTVARARAFVDAGADGFFVPGLTETDAIAVLVNAVDAPLNIMAMPGAPNIAASGRLGVRRVSVGAGIAQAVMAFVRTGTAQFLDSGGLDAMPMSLSFAEANALFARAQAAE